MAHVSGPTSGMPGRILEPIKGHTCDTEGHEDRPSVKMVQGETDSFGAEYCDLCEECYKKELGRKREKEISTCEWCKTPNVEVHLSRDYSEGMHGPVYSVCLSCIHKQNDELDDELASYNNWD